ncbi:MAG TPA: hypothetical protein DEB06_09125 [Phycisphaerales bacterium]|nr:hypothetical protein [Phycisphaerales bacterium]
MRGPETDAVLGEEPWSFGPSKGVVVRTTHYRLFTTMDDPALRARVPRFMEEALAHYRTALGDLPAPTVRLDSYLMANRTQWAAVAQRIMGEQASAVLGITRGGFAARGVGVYFDIGLYDTLAVAAHEGWHQYTQRVFREPLPVWLEEGIASYMEGHQWVDGAARFAPWANLERFDQLRKAASLGKLVSLGDLLEATPQALLSGADDRALTYYAQVWALTHFLHDGEDGRYRTSLRRVVREASSGMLSRTLQSELGHRAAAGAMARRNGPGVALAYFSADLSRLESEYRAFVEAIVATGGRGRAVSGSAGAAR